MKKNIKHKVFSLLINVLALGIFQSCSCPNQPDATPKPNAYHRIDLPANHQYNRYQDPNCPFAFEVERSATVQNVPNSNCWKNIVYPKLQATLYLSYKKINTPNDLIEYTEDSYKLTFKHSIKANAIGEQRIGKPNQNVYGLLYTIEGNAATPVQFYLTDSTQHFLRAALYFNASPNADSIAPVLQFIKKDLDRLIQTFEWQ